MLFRSAAAEIRTPGRIAVVNVTGAVRQELRGGGVGRGVAFVSVPHTTCGLCVNEDEAGLKQDLARLAAGLLEPLARSGPFDHDRIDDNARAHLMSVLIGHSVMVPVEEDDLRLGTWQSIFLLEMDGPRTRRLEMTFLGDPG